ncbi:MAG: YecA family protein [Actinomycetota bacterium]
MAKLGRNDLCPCGSSRKVKRCCGVQRGPSQAQLDQAFLFTQARAAARSLLSLDDEELRSLWEQLFDLPERSLSLLVPLPKIITPDLQRLMKAVSDEDPEESEEAMPTVLKRVDTPQNRAALARSVLALKEAGELEEFLAAVAIIDLADQSRSALVCASLIRSILVASGAASTPAGLIVRRSLLPVA